MLVMNATKTNEDECRAKRWLESQGHTDIIRLCEDPPDFVVEGRYAVEVRRLNWMADIDGKYEGIENSEKPLERYVEELLEPYSQAPNGYTVFVDCNYRFDPPIPKRDVIGREVKAAVEEFKERMRRDLELRRCPSCSEISLECGVTLLFWPDRTPGTGGFELNDVDVATGSRGFVVRDAIDNVARSIQEKTRKVVGRDRVNDFAAWWLVLVDHIHAVPLREADLNRIRRALPRRDIWSRVIVVSPENPEWFFEL